MSVQKSTRQQMIELLDETPWSTLDELHTHFELEKSSVRRLLNRMERDGLVKKRPCLSDARKIEYRLI